MAIKVLFVFILPSGGVDTLNRMRHKALARKGIEAHFLYFQSGSGAQNYADTTVFYAEDPEAIRSILNAGGYAAVVVLSFFGQVRLFRELGFAGPILFEIQGFGPMPQARETLLSAKPFLAPYVNAYLYPMTPHLRDILREGYPEAPHFAFNNPFDADTFHYQHMAPYPRPIAGWIGRLEPNKNWKDFLRIAARTAEDCPDLEVWMLSDPWLAMPGEQEEMRGMVASLGLERRLREFHHVPHHQMPNILSIIGDSGGVLCITSLSEGACYAAVEALSCHCPVVTSDSDGVRTSLIDEQTALYYEHGDVGGAAAQVARLMNDKDLRSRLIARGEEHVRQNFHPDLYAANFVQMLQSLGVPGC
ncbi:glycosyltransferase family 4 protein [Cohnella zeiphila]|uniref:Glycosyltransferase family 4 protein n=1 Tax=Cohnella zeiphila TaxID=2761120 RepID=A0A7X0SMC4_9BACL|nr:glycosyltransferase family 4 protein [Cohnella zeiphila]MBB6732586.1 glycosyltransferase family 4 protein [Cohnella zeiphila]